jgi:hypothetical protein
MSVENVSVAEHHRQDLFSGESACKEDIRKPMKAEDVAKIINLKEHMSFMATVKKDGKPHLSWDLFAYWNDTLYAFSTPRSVSYWNLLRSGNVAMLIANSAGTMGVFI